MSRVLVTGGAGRIGSAVVRRLLRDPDFEVRVSDQRPAPVWMREGAAVHTADLRLLDEARKALLGCTHVVHVAALEDASQPFTRLEVNAALDVAILRAAFEAGVERCTFVAASAFGEALGRAAQEQHGLRFTLCRPAGVYGPGFDGVVADLLRAARGREPLAADSDAAIALTYVDDVADAIVLATAAQDGLGQTFAIAASAPLREVAELCWSACGNAPEELVLTPAVDPGAEVPSATALERATGWRPAVAPRDGIARSLASLDHIPGGN